MTRLLRPDVSWHGWMCFSTPATEKPCCANSRAIAAPTTPPAPTMHASNILTGCAVSRLHSLRSWKIREDAIRSLQPQACNVIGLVYSPDVNPQISVMGLVDECLGYKIESRMYCHGSKVFRCRNEVREFRS